MNINQLIQPSANAQVKVLVESNVNDPDNKFSKETLNEIMENVVHAKFSGKPKTLQEFKEWLDSV